ncbi:MAG: hypothetical protein WKG00_23605 [Polyangiaceae bacterium]
MTGGRNQAADCHPRQRAGFDAHLVKPTYPMALLRLFAGRKS